MLFYIISLFGISIRKVVLTLRNHYTLHEYFIIIIIIHNNQNLWEEECNLVKRQIAGEILFSAR